MRVVKNELLLRSNFFYSVSRFHRKENKAPNTFRLIRPTACPYRTRSWITKACPKSAAQSESDGIGAFGKVGARNQWLRRALID